MGSRFSSLDLCAVWTSVGNLGGWVEDSAVHSDSWWYQFVRVDCIANLKEFTSPSERTV